MTWWDSTNDRPEKRESSDNESGKNKSEWSKGGDWDKSSASDDKEKNGWNDSDWSNKGGWGKSSSSDDKMDTTDKWNNDEKEEKGEEKKEDTAYDYIEWGANKRDEWRKKRQREEDEEGRKNDWKAKASKNGWGEKKYWENGNDEKKGGEDGDDSKTGWSKDGWKQAAEEDDDDADEWIKNDSPEWKKDEWKKDDNGWGKYEHGTPEWRKALDNGQVGLPYKPGDEKLTQVFPQDFMYFNSRDCRTWTGAPKVVLQSPSFWVFGKNVNWVCSNIHSYSVKSFQPGAMTSGKESNEDALMTRHVDGSLPCYIIATFGKQYPFVCENTESFNVSDLISHGKVKSGFGLLHRLDRETSGAVLVAKNPQAFERLVAERNNHNWHKEYVALIHGKIPAEKWKGVIDIPLKRRANNRTNASFTVDACQRCRDKNQPRKCKGLDDEGYECVGPAKSYYEVVKYYSHTRADTGETLDFTLVRVKLVSGKTHQIRVHMKNFSEELGFPACGLVSDFKYLKETAEEQYKYDAKHFMNRVALHEAVLGFRDPDDPFKNQVAKVELPDDIQKMIKKTQVNQEAMDEMLYAQEEMMKTKMGHFATEFMLNKDAEENLKKCSYGSDEVIDAFLARCTKRPNPDNPKKPKYNAAVRSFNGDHSAMVDRIVANIDKETLEELLDREFPETVKADADDENLPLPPGWERIRSKSTNQYFYWNEKLGKNQILHPARELQEGLPSGWRKVQSKRDPSVWYYLDTKTQNSYMELPTRKSSTTERGGGGPVNSYGITRTSTQDTGVFRGSLAASQPQAQVVKKADEWVKKESKSQRGRYYYRNDARDISNPWHPLGLESLPRGWKRMESSSLPGKYYFIHPESDKTQLEHPTTNKTWLDVPEDSMWVCRESTSKKGTYYFVNKRTHESTTKHPLTGKFVVA